MLKWKGSGTCSAMFTANSMSSAVEALGMTLPHTASHPVVDENNKYLHDNLNLIHSHMYF